MNYNRRSTDRRQGRGNNSNSWNGPERRGPGRPWAVDMAVMALEPRVLYYGGAFGEPDIDMPYVFDVAATNETMQAQAGATGGTKIPVAGGVPALHSRPGATARIVIDFDGDAATQWGNYNVPATPAYDQDGDPTTFNSAELASINEIFLRVAEKYSPFNIDVTTVDPGGTYLNRETVKVVVGGSGSWLGSLAGGVAFIGAFYNMTDNVAYVFPANLSNGYAKYTAEAIAHEAGHTFGLQHQGQYNGTTLVQEYNPGNSLVAPIMGNSYYAARGLWWYGTPSNNSSATQDDLLKLSGTSNAFGYRADDYGNSTGTATLLTPSNNTFSAAGVVEQYTDADYFSFTTGAATLTLTLSVAQYGAMLDGSLFVYDGSGTLVASADTSSLGESLTLSLSSGTYYVKVAGHGGYGDIGQYTLSGSLVATPPPQPVTVADPSGVTVSPLSAGEILVGWADNSSNETGFVIQRSTDNGSTWTTLATTGADVTSYRDTTVSGGRTYVYRVLAYNDSTSSNYTAGVSGTTVPTAPTSLVATANSGTQVTLTWSDVYGETSYTVERSVDGTTWTQVGTTGANVTSYVDTTASAGTSYTYRVRALDATGPSAYSSYATVVTFPATPGTIAAVANSASQITVTWSDVSGETAYLVERSADGVSGWALVGSTSAGVTSFVDTGRSGGTRYYYRVRASNGSGASAYTTVANALTLPSVPGTPVVTAVSATQATVTWSAVTGATSYVVERSPDGSTWSTLTTTGTTTVNDMTLSAGTRYYYRVRAVNTSGSSASGTSANVLTYPGVPGSVAATANSASKVTITWDSVQGAAGYDVERSADGSTGWTRVATSVAGTSYIDDELTAETEYFYRVRATNASGASAYGSTVSATTLEPVIVVIDPAYLILVPSGANQMNVAWQDNSDNEDGFILERSEDDGATWTTVAVTDPNVTTYVDTGLAGGTTYVYRVRAYSGSVLSDYATTSAATTAPAAPTGVGLWVVSNGVIRMTWSADAGATGYEIERSADGAGGWVKVGTTAADVTAYEDTGLAGETRYYYRVRATGASGNSEYSAAVNTVTFPDAPGAVRVATYGSGRLYVSWDAVPRARGYEVERSLDGVSGWGLVATTGGAGVTFDDTGLAANTAYYYRVRAIGETGISDYAAAAAGLTLTAAPGGVTASPVSAGSIRVTWAAIGGVIGYVVERSTDFANWSAVATTAGGETQFADSGLLPNTTYYYRVRAINAAGTGEASAVASATTAQTAPVAPVSLTLFQISSTSVQLMWEDRSGNESGFKVEYSTDGRTWKLAGNVPANTVAARVTGLEAGHRYWFRVSAYNEMGFSGTTNTVTSKQTKALKLKARRGLATAGLEPATITLDIRKVKNYYPGLSKSLLPDAATELTATPYSSTAVQLTWTDNSDTELGFRVEYSVNGRNWVLAGYVGADQTGCRITGLAKGNAYKFRVSAYNLAGVTTKSATAKSTMPRQAPTGSHAKPSYEKDQDTVLNVLRVKDVAPGLSQAKRVA